MVLLGRVVREQYPRAGRTFRAVASPATSTSLPKQRPVFPKPADAGELFK